MSSLPVPAKAEFVPTDAVDIEDLSKLKCLKPCVPMYGPILVRDLPNGAVKYWCTCGLSKTQPWCDNSHVGTEFKPLKWVVSGNKRDGKPQTLYSICNCKYTRDPPYCDARHIDLPCDYLDAQEQCKEDHSKIEKLCTKCGFKAPAARIQADEAGVV
ncbi:uncharacterized protein BJ171DRAFT_148632 [Polychytrium aggregatum]|uniref:uncharacterized protein n=1 Tax=Polychytrium aggregatum TaxID=110093 RepID=UPI0022FDEB59|nr:uncharacterized protein BJ171DRAFT_148632 [Polychytrium aggregatum]KAI9203266.1 hypothetical protein BJ171DRAFT_148632 [Polychytrium aggregatum]